MDTNMNPIAWSTSFILLPTIITEPGDYITRCGERVTIYTTAAQTRAPFNCYGHYSNGTVETWHKSGRLYFGQECANDIVRKA